MRTSYDSTPTERDPLLSRESQLSQDSATSAVNVPGKVLPHNHVSKTTLVWILFGLWSAVFLGALDGL